MKRCGACGAEKDKCNFHVRRASPDGLAYKCKECVNRHSREWRERNPGAHQRWYSENRSSRRQYNKQWREANPEFNRARMSQWMRENMVRVREKNMRRHAQKVSATPAWARMDKIRLVYEEAERLTKATGVRYEVDHIVPIQGKIVSGLHWEGNLQILTKAENIAKRNRYWPDMP